jgi:arylsulfatase
MRFVILVLLAAGIPVQAATKPNVVLILADDLGFSDLGCYGGEIDTPVLDGLAKAGLCFTQCYNTARCWPSRAALLTGYYAQHIRRDKLPGVPGGGIPGKRPNWARLLPDFLKPHGYRCYHTGKWHIDGKVLAGGFDRSLSMNNPGNFFTSRGSFLNDVAQKVPEDEKNYYSTIETANHAIACLKDHAAEHADKPFFQYVAFHAPHFPLHAPQAFIDKYRDRYLDGWEKMRETRFARQQKLGFGGTLSAIERNVGPPHTQPGVLKILGPDEVNRPVSWDSLTKEQRRFQATKMAIHAAMVDCMDREIGRIVEQLRAMKALDNTIVLFASDNGASAEMLVRDGGHDPKAAPGSAKSYLCLGPGFSSACNTPFRRHKTWVHEGGITTPLIVHWPAGIAAKGELRHAPVHFIDVVPTVLDLVQIDKPKDWNGTPIPPAPGKSFAPALAKDVPIARESLWWLHEGHRALRVGDWKVVADAGKPWELYNLATDRAEQHNLADKHPEKTRELSALWEEQTNRFIETIKGETGKK